MTRHNPTTPATATATATASPATSSGDALQQGQCVQITAELSPAAQKDDQLYQVISIDDRHDRCWVRRWPLARHGSEVFEISLQHVRPSRPHRP
jgi:hypothetical protein